MRLMLALLLLFTTFALEVRSDEAVKEKIGVLIPLSGPFARYGDLMRSVISSEFSEDGSLKFEDEGCDARKGVVSYQRLSTQEDVRYFLGPWCGSPQLAIATLMRNKSQIAILGSSASEKLFSLSGGKMYSTQPSIETESEFNAEHLNNEGVEKVVILFKDQQFSRAHEAAFKARFAGKILETLVFTEADASALKPLISRVQQLKPDLLYVPDAFPLLIGLTDELRSVGITIPVHSVYSAQADDILKIVARYSGSFTYSYPKIGDDVAIEHYSKIASRILKELVSCGKNIDCAKKQLLDKGFDENGMLEGSLGIKTIKDANFVWK